MSFSNVDLQNNTGLIDSHCHLPRITQKKYLEEVLAGAKESGVYKMINVGTSIKENARVLEVARNYDQVFPTAAIYPHKDMDKDIEYLRKYLEEFLDENEKYIVGIGECGIDISGWKEVRPVADQITLFEMQAKLAKIRNLPLIVHNRNGDNQVLDVLKNIKPPKVVIHCFSSSWEFAREILDLGYLISFSGFITYPNRSDLIETVEKVPIDRFLIETDSPYLSPEGFRDKKNEPKYVKLVAEKVAYLKGISFEEVALRTSENTQAFFGI